MYQYIFSICFHSLFLLILRVMSVRKIYTFLFFQMCMVSFFDEWWEYMFWYRISRVAYCCFVFFDWLINKSLKKKSKIRQAYIYKSVTVMLNLFYVVFNMYIHMFCRCNIIILNFIFFFPSTMISICYHIL